MIDFSETLTSPQKAKEDFGLISFSKWGKKIDSLNLSTVKKNGQNDFLFDQLKNGTNFHIHRKKHLHKTFAKTERGPQQYNSSPQTDDYNSNETPMITGKNFQNEKLKKVKDSYLDNSTKFAPSRQHQGRQSMNIPLVIEVGNMFKPPNELNKKEYCKTSRIKGMKARVLNCNAFNNSNQLMTTSSSQFSVNKKPKKIPGFIRGSLRTAKVNGENNSQNVFIDPFATTNKPYTAHSGNSYSNDRDQKPAKLFNVFDIRHRSGIFLYFENQRCSQLINRQLVH